MKHTGDLTITDQNLKTCLVLAEVTGWLCVLAEGAQFPKLVKTGALDVQAEGAQFPKLAEVTGGLCVRAEGAQFPKLGRVIAMSTWGLVALYDGRLSAGCRGPWTRAKALAHWGKRTDERAKLFTAAIKQLGEDA